MKLGIIILVTRPKSLLLCLEGLLEQTYDHTDFEIILILSNDCIVDIPPTNIRIARIIENNLHLCVRRNAGVRHTIAEYIAFLDDDTVPPVDWAANALAAMERHQCDGVCGPITHFDTKRPLPYRLSGASTDSVFLEGFNNTSASTTKRIEFYNIPGCNCVVKKRVWEATGGFNEHMYAYMDDIEFFYSATRHGFFFLMIPELKVQHGIAPFPLAYLKKNLVTRFHTGINTIVFHELHGQIPYIRIALMGAAGALCLPFFSVYLPILLITAGSLYFTAAFYFALQFFRADPLTSLLLPFVFFTTHAVNFIAFIAGLLYGATTWNQYHSIITVKNARLQKCPN